MKTKHKFCKACGSPVDNELLSYCPVCDEVLVVIDPEQAKRKKQKFGPEISEEQAITKEEADTDGEEYY